jgi:two-component system NtrC family sensor kinase
MYRTRKIMVTSLVIILIVTGVFILFVTRKFIDRFRVTAERSQELKSQLFHASKLASIGELATGIAHEINNPLAIITSTSGVIRDMLDPQFELDASPGAIVKEIDIIESAAFRAGKITRQLLDFGHDYTPFLALCDVNGLLDEVISGVKAREFIVANIDIVRHYDPDLPRTFLDPDQVRQVFLNIINNAGDAITGAGRITVSTATLDGHLRITIRDTGTGMTATEISKIFDPFFTTKEVGKGTGLGLSVSLSIVESLGGSIAVQSLKGEGSSFTISLPIRGEQDIPSTLQPTKGAKSE